MKVLVAHNRYRSGAPSGENGIVDAEIELLLSHGVEVVTCLTTSDDLAGSVRLKVDAAFGPIYSASGVARFADLLDRERPDLVHLHNVFPLLSPWIVRASKSAGLPVVQTVHNYRHTCLNGLHVRDGARCDDCLGRRIPWPGIVHGCYRGSRLQGLPMAASQALHRPTWELVDRFVALTPFMVDRLVAAGFPADRVELRPTWVPDQDTPQPADGRAIAFVGRLDVAKGVRLLLEAWDSHRPPDRVLLLAGDGPLRSEVEDHAARDPSITYLGPVASERVPGVLADAAAVVVPSVFYEGFPLTVAEAFRAGKPVILMRGSSPASSVTDAVSWSCDLSSESLGRTIASLSDEDAQGRGEAARQFYESELTPDVAVGRILSIYRDVLADSCRFS